MSYSGQFFLNPSLRKAAEATIQRNEAMKNKSTLLNNHSKQVGEDHYDPTPEQVRTEYVNCIEHMENSQVDKEEEEFPEDKKRSKRKKEMEEEDAKVGQKHAGEYLQSLKDRSQKNRTYNTRCKVKNKHKVFLMTIVKKEIFNSTVQVFPKGKNHYYLKI